MKTPPFARLCASLLLGSSLVLATPIHEGPGADPLAMAALPDGDSNWNLVWDDKVDDLLDGHSKSCRLHLSIGGREVSGRFDGPVLGESRNAHFFGHVVRSNKTSLLLLWQEEEDYTCVYQMQVLQDGRLFGAWHDTLGRKGDVELRRAGA